MTPRPTTTQDLDVLERVGKYVGSLAIIAGAVTALVRWFRKRHDAREQKRAELIVRVTRERFANELAALTSASNTVGVIAQQVNKNTDAIAEMAQSILVHLNAGDETLGLMLDYVRENREWIDDLQSFIDHVHGIDRRASVGQDRRQRTSDKFDALERRRAERRAVIDGLRRLPQHTDPPIIPPMPLDK
jgi:vacuolar-type H+-ATPase subunit I/STV1